MLCDRALQFRSHSRLCRGPSLTARQRGFRTQTRCACRARSTTSVDLTSSLDFLIFFWPPAHYSIWAGCSSTSPKPNVVYLQGALSAHQRLSKFLRGCCDHLLHPPVSHSTQQGRFFRGRAEHSAALRRAQGCQGMPGCFGLAAGWGFPPAPLQHIHSSHVSALLSALPPLGRAPSFPAAGQPRAAVPGESPLQEHTGCSQVNQRGNHV